MKQWTSIASGSSPAAENNQWSTYRFQASSDALAQTAQPNAQHSMPQHIAGPEISIGMPCMDQLHHEIFTALEEVSCCADHEFVVCYAALAAKIERAFRQEEQWMDEIGFSVMNTHQEQHARVLGALHNVHFHVMDGDLELGRRVVEELMPQWFLFHRSTMDVELALAMQLAQKRAGELSAQPN